jgi:2-dehydropantoate 2-reductase
MNVTIIGAGAIGGTVGAFMTRAGHDVTVVDIVREHVDAINREGLLITGIRGDHRYPLRAIHASDLAGPLRNVILAVKGHFTEDVVRDQIEPLLADDGYVVSLQNGLNEETIAGIIGPERTVGAFVHFGADYLAPGHVQLGQEQDIYLGELDGSITPRLLELQDALSSVMPVHLTDNIFGYLWGKLVYGSMAFAVSTVDAKVPEVLSDPRGHEVARAASIETATVASALDYDVQPIGRFYPSAFIPGPNLIERADAALAEFRAEMAGSMKQHMGIWRDLKIKKRATEVDVQCAVVVDRAATAGIDVPVNRAIVRVIHEIEDGTREMDWSNLDDLAAAIPTT